MRWKLNMSAKRWSSLTFFRKRGNSHLLTMFPFYGSFKMTIGEHGPGWTVLGVREDHLHSDLCHQLRNRAIVARLRTNQLTGYQFVFLRSSYLRIVEAVNMHPRSSAESAIRSAACAGPQLRGACPGQWDAKCWWHWAREFCQICKSWLLPHIVSSSLAFLSLFPKNVFWQSFCFSLQGCL